MMKPEIKPMYRKYFHKREYIKELMKEDISDNQYKHVLRENIYYDNLLDKLWNENVDIQKLKIEYQDKIRRCILNITNEKPEGLKLKTATMEVELYTAIVTDIEDLILDDDESLSL